MTMKVIAEDLQPGDILIGVLSGQPWREIRGISRIRDRDQYEGSGYAVLLDAVPVGLTAIDSYSPIEIWAEATVEIVDRVECDECNGAGRHTGRPHTTCPICNGTGTTPREETR